MGSTVQVIGVGVRWQRLSCDQETHWLHNSETTPHTAYENPKAAGNADATAPSDRYHMQMITSQESGISQPHCQASATPEHWQSSNKAEAGNLLL